MTALTKKCVEKLDDRYVTKDHCAKVRFENQKELSKICSDMSSMKATGKIIVGILGAIGTLLLTVAVYTLFRFGY